MNSNKDELLKQVNIDIIFFFLATIASITSLSIIIEKKKSILGIKCIDNNTANKVYKYNRKLFFIIAIYFFLNAYYSYQNAKDDDEKKQEKLLLIATFFTLIGNAFYLPLGNSNLIIEN